MIGTLPVSELSPLEYRTALDAAMGMLPRSKPLLVRCSAPELLPEVRQRLPQAAEPNLAQAALWVEPLRTGWRKDLDDIGEKLGEGGFLITMTSRPLARALPERGKWASDTLGVQLGGLRALRRALLQDGFSLQAAIGFHPLSVMGINLLGRALAAVGRTDLGDRLERSSREKYIVTGSLASFSTVALLVHHRGR